MLQYNGLTLAYIGDAVYETYVRQKMIEQGYHNVDSLHQNVIKLTSAEGQFEALNQIKPMLSETELSIVKRGRNSDSTRRTKNASLQTYKWATGFEALVGYLYLNNEKKRLNDLLAKII